MRLVLVGGVLPQLSPGQPPSLGLWPHADPGTPWVVPRNPRTRWVPPAQKRAWERAAGVTLSNTMQCFLGLAEAGPSFQVGQECRPQTQPVEDPHGK